MDLVGRDESLALLADAAARAREGHGGLVMVRADPGTGVTALLDAHLAQVRAAGLPAYRVPVLATGLSSLSAARPPDWAGPAVVVVDDLHLADDATLLALHALADPDHGRPLSVVTGRRRGSSPARFAGLDRLATVVHDLAPLDEAAVARRWGADPAAAGACGNPRLLNALRRPAELAAWATELAGPDAALARWIALLAEHAELDALAALTGTAPEAVLAAVDRLRANALLSPDAIRLHHPVVRQALAAASAALRPAAARRLARHGVPDPTVLRLLAEAPVDAWAVAWLLRRADRLNVRPTPALLKLLARAAEHLPLDDPRRARLVVALVEAHYWSGDRPAARRLARAQLTAPLPTPLRRRLRVILAKAALAEMDPAAALALIAAEQLDDGRLHPRLALLRTYACLQLGDLDTVKQSLPVASAAADEDPLLAIALLNLRAIERTASHDLAGAVELLDQVDAMLETTAYDRVEWLDSRLLRAVIQDLRSDPAIDETVEQARPMAELLGAFWLPWLHTVAALSAYRTGRWEQALAEVDAAMALPNLYGMGRPLHAVAALILLHRGELDAGRARLASAERSVARNAALFYEQVVAVARATVAELTGEHRQALEIVRTVTDGMAEIHPSKSTSLTGSELVRIAVNSGGQEEARRLTEAIRNRTTDNSPGRRGALRFAEGLVVGDPDLLLAAAHDLADAGSLVAAAHADDQAALLFAASGRAEDARAAHRQAVSRFGALAATGEIDRATAALRAHGVRLGATGSRRRPAHGWASLTRAERRVAELVARGLTDREIADRLIVSVRTVHSHVSRILAKLGYSSRVEVLLAFSRAEGTDLPDPDLSGFLGRSTDD
ncbi:LuxR C-terminal-related transcriptional regulator [Kitasatospora sp. NPDC006697]|uniref:helix-turn-helix transcriptional regulator n=1 Tax=Kitasatospora sp. NPDC006697 TaxID=3364020 RepID=UPI0036B3187C